MKKKLNGHKSINSAFNGVLIYIYNNHPELKTEKEVFKWFNQCNQIMISFLKDINSDFKDNNTDKSRTFNANKVQDNFKKFKQYLYVKSIEN